MSLNHPLHAAIVHWPLAFLTASFAIDSLSPCMQILPSGVLRYLPNQSELACVSYYALSAGLLAGLAAVVSGVLQANEVNRGGVYEADKKTLKPKIKTLFLHAGLNDIILLTSTWYWWMRRQAGGSTYRPETWMVGLSSILGISLLFTANLGATLVYKFGAGMRIAKQNVKDQ